MSLPVETWWLPWSSMWGSHPKPSCKHLPRRHEETIRNQSASLCPGVSAQKISLPASSNAYWLNLTDTSLVICRSNWRVGNSEKHEKTWENIRKHKKTWENMRKHEKTWENMRKHEKTWETAERDMWLFTNWSPERPEVPTATQITT
jgi:hypothetical protein